MEPEILDTGLLQDGIEALIHSLPRPLCPWLGRKYSIFTKHNSLNVTDDFMKEVTAYESVHVRIGETLKAVGLGKRTPPEILEVVADQEDWHKRLRELRYPVAN